MYEVFVQDSVAFTDTTGERLFVGQVLDVTSRKDIGAQILDERNRIDFASLPLDRAIRTVRGDGRRKLAVFADPDCPFCHELEQTLAGITDVTIYTFLYPLAELHPEAPAKARALWCAPDRARPGRTGCSGTSRLRPGNVRSMPWSRCWRWACS